MDNSYESITQRYAPHTTEVILYFIAEEAVQEIPSYPHLKLVVNKPARIKSARGLRS